MLTFVPRQHVLEVNKHVDVDKSLPKDIYFLIVGLENKYYFGKLERPWAHELTSQTGGELMSWSPSVSAALIYIYTHIHIGLHTVNTKQYDTGTGTGEMVPVVSVSLTVTVSLNSVAWLTLLQVSIANMCGSIPQFLDKND